jgi:hypothetical protein
MSRDILYIIFRIAGTGVDTFARHMMILISCCDRLVAFRKSAIKFLVSANRKSSSPHMATQAEMAGDELDGSALSRRTVAAS